MAFKENAGGNKKRKVRREQKKEKIKQMFT